MGLRAFDGSVDICALYPEAEWVVGVLVFSACEESFPIDLVHLLTESIVHGFFLGR